MPREFKAESCVEVVGRLSDDQLAAMIAELNERIQRKLSDADAKVINANVETGAAALAPPAKETLWDIGGRHKRNPKRRPTLSRQLREKIAKRIAAGETP
jgi:hypothetical protein